MLSFERRNILEIKYLNILLFIITVNTCFLAKTFALGSAEFPKARQIICYEYGGLWSGESPNAACAATINTSGTYPLVQRNDFFAVIPDFNSNTKMKEKIVDGMLCYAGDPLKAGIGVEHTEWTRTEVSGGKLEYVFYSSIPHIPAYWEFYLTKPGTDTSMPLKWSDVELIDTHRNIALGVDKRYRMEITLPHDREGDAILFTRWQHDNETGNGVYNCSDLTIKKAKQRKQVTARKPRPLLHQAGSFLPENFEVEKVQVGELARYDVYKKSGQLHTTYSIEITEDNQYDWDRLLSAEISAYYAYKFNGAVFIGAWHDEMKHYMYFSGYHDMNFFNSVDGLYEGKLSIINGFINTLSTEENN